MEPRREQADGNKAVQDRGRCREAAASGGVELAGLERCRGNLGDRRGGSDILSLTQAVQLSAERSDPADEEDGGRELAVVHGDR